MKDLFIKGSVKHPEISFSVDGHLKISGVSVLEDSYEFYRKPITWVDEYLLQPAEKTIVDIDLSFFNTSSQVNLFEILMKLAELQRSGYDVTFNWFYAEEDLLDLGQDISNLLGINFNFVRK